MPVVVTGEPETVKMPGRERATEVTVPEPPAPVQPTTPESTRFPPASIATQWPLVRLPVVVARLVPEPVIV